jgi:hypothetical protein
VSCEPPSAVLCRDFHLLLLSDIALYLGSGQWYDVIETQKGQSGLGRYFPN